MSHIVKRRGHMEKFSDKKLFDSVKYACQSTHMDPKAANPLSREVVAEIKKWMKDRHAVTSDQIFRQVIAALKKKKQDDCAFMYETHRDIS